MSESPNPSSGLLPFLVRQRMAVATVALLLALGLAVLTLMAGRWYPDLAVPLVLWGLGVTFGLLTFGLLHLFIDLNENQLSLERIIVLSSGGMIGLACTMGSLLLAWALRGDILSWLEPGGEKRNAWGVLLAVAGLIGGVAILFFSLRLAQAEERQRPALRRLFYGYNAALTGLLLFLNLLMFNTMVAAWTQKPEDFTANKVHSLSATSDNILKRLEKPVQVYVILNPGPRYGGLDLFADMRQLLLNCSQITDKIVAPRDNFLIPLDPQDRFALINMASKYPALIQNLGGGDAEPKEGVLIVYGQGEQQDHRFIPLSDLFTSASGRGQRGPQQSLFRGEEALMTELSFLTDEQRKTTVYFTQGHGELSLEDARGAQGIGFLKRRLEKRNFVIKPLTFSPAEALVPADANLVVVAGPRDPLPDFALRALGEYFGKRQGKLILLLDLVVDPEGRSRPNGFEDFLIDSGVQLGNERVIGINQLQFAFLVQGAMNPEARCQLAAALKEARFILQLPRSVEPAPRRQPGMSRPVESLVINLGPAVTEKNLQADPRQVIQQLTRNPVELKKRLSPRPISLAVAVGDAPPFNPHDPGGMSSSVDERPRMVVFGSSGLISNRFISEVSELPVNNFDLMTNTIDWLRERKGGLAGIGPKVHPYYTIDSTIGGWRLVGLPAALIFIGLLGLGMGVWLVRRR